MTPLISVTNQTSVLTDDEVRPFVAALQIQVTRDFYPAWGINATIQLLPTSQSLPDEAWQLALLDNTDQSGFLGYHLKSPKGTPLGKVFVKTDQSHGLNWTVTGSHEALEMLGDPGANLVLMLEGGAHAREVCDAVEDEQFQYWIDVPGYGKVAMSNFTYPRYWLPGAAPGQYDHCGVLNAGMPTLLTGGYDSVEKNGVWQQVFGEESALDRGRLEREFHRRLLRATPESERHWSLPWWL